MARYGSVRRGSGVRRFASPSPAGGGTGPDMARILPGVPVGEYRTVSQCRAMSRDGAGRGLPRVFRYVPLDRLRRSRPPLQWNRCRVYCVAFALSPLSGGFSVGEGRSPGAGARIRAGAGTVTAPGVPLTAAYCPGRGTYGPAAGPGVPGALYRPGYMPAGRREEERLPHPAINVRFVWFRHTVSDIRAG